MQKIMALGKTLHGHSIPQGVPGNSVGVETSHG